MRKHLAMFILTASTSMAGFGVPSASADCTVNFGTCDASSNCTVNVAMPDVPDVLEWDYDGNCTNGSFCTVNIGNCHDGGACTINTGDCSNGDDATICHNTVCDNAAPGADSEGYAGFGCSFDGGNEASGIVFNNPTKEFGVMTAGPWVVIVSDPTTNTVQDLTITCTMQNSPTYGAGGTSRTTICSGNVCVLVDTISFKRVPGVSTWLFTTVEWNSTKGHTVVIDDADNDSSNGYQGVEYTYTN